MLLHLLKIFVVEKELFSAFLGHSHFEMFYSHTYYAHVRCHVLCLQTDCFNSECDDRLCSTGDSNWLCDFTKIKNSVQQSTLFVSLDVCVCVCVCW